MSRRHSRTLSQAYVLALGGVEHEDAAYTCAVVKRRAVYCLAVVTTLSIGVIGSPPFARAWDSSRAARTRSIVTLGDSVPRGTHCHCTPYPKIIAARLSETSSQAVSATNDSVAGYTTANVLRQLTADQTVIARVRGADAVEIEIGANDVPYSTSCGPTIGCYAARVPAMKTRLSQIVRRVDSLTSGRRVDVVLLDYWSVWLGGRYAAVRGRAYVVAAREITARVNAAIKSIAAKTGSGYVDLRAAFKGPNYAYDETHYMSNDGDHPNAAGHRRIAIAAEAVIKNALHI
jgi:lysophospholipase L1-like esterase